MGRQALEDAKRAQHFFIDPLQAAPPSAKGHGFDGPYRVQIIGLDTAHRSKGEHPLWQARATQLLEESFVLNLRKYGNHNAVKVRKVKTGESPDDYVLEVIDGRQRARGMRKAALDAKGDGTVAPRLKVELEKGDGDTLVGIMISLNQQRFDDSATAKAKEASDLVHSLGYGIKEVALMYGRSPQTVRNWLDLVGLDKRVQKLVDERRLTATSAITLKDLPLEDQYQKAEEMAEAGVVSGEAKAQARRRKNGKAEAPPRGKRPTIKVLRALVDNEGFAEGLSEDARDLLHWIVGDDSRAERIEGLSAALNGDVP